MTAGHHSVLILGAGINGCALARELALNGVSVWLVDTDDLASGATSGSSRLIHGGLRYLEYGELALVKESLAERTRLLQLAPQFVQPLKLWIPLASRWGGSIGAVGRFFGWEWWPAPQPKRGRGVMLVRAGLALYDAYARDPSLPGHEVMRTSAAETLAIDRGRYRWLGSYYDAQLAFPERLVVALLDDARRLSETQLLDMRVFTHHRATLDGRTVRIEPVGASSSAEAISLEPSAIVNATGAWVDETLARLHVDSKRLIGGTKGSHFFTFDQRLRQAIAGQGVYAEASDGRPIFILPLADGVLVGTTDIPIEGSPDNVVATDEELHYLLAAVNEIMAGVRLEMSDIDFHCCAVRPLPYVDASSPAAITRRHALVRHERAVVPLYSIIGGKLTTMRSLAESAAATVLASIGRAVVANSRDRSIPGAANWPGDAVAVEGEIARLAQRSGFSAESVAAAWRLLGTRAADVLSAASDRELLPDNFLPTALARWSIENEWACTLADLVERRLMLLYHQRLTRACLVRLATLLAEAGRLHRTQLAPAVDDQILRLKTRFGKQID